MLPCSIIIIKQIRIAMFKAVLLTIQCILTLCVAQSSENIDYIDTFEPIMRSSPEMSTFTGDYFGYTAVLHKLVKNGDMDDVR